LKFAAKEKREDNKAELEETRKQELHEIKLMEAANKANQSLGHKENEHKAKMSEHGGPLSAGMILGSKNVEAINPAMTSTVQGNGSQLTQGHANGGVIGKPLSGQPRVGGRPLGGRHPVMPSDTVPAMLTPGEAVIPRAAAQDPRNKPAIQRMVQQGRQAQGMPVNGFANGGMVPTMTGKVQLQNQLAVMPQVGPKKHRLGYADGTTGVPVTAPVEETYLEKLKRVLGKKDVPVEAPQLGGMVGQAQEALKTRTKKLDDEINKQINGYAGGTTEVPVPENESYLDKIKRVFGQKDVPVEAPKLGGMAGQAQEALKTRTKKIDEEIDKQLRGYADGDEYVESPLAYDSSARLSRQGIDPVVISAPLTATWSPEYQNKTFGIESGGKATAQNPRSTAGGLGQFTAGTFEGLKKNNPNASYAKTAFKSPEYYSGVVQTDLMKDYTNENSKALVNKGITPTNADLYGAHFLNPSEYAKVVNAPQDAKLDSFLQEKDLAANPHLRGMTAGQFRNINRQKYGEDIEYSSGPNGRKVNPTVVDPLNPVAPPPSISKFGYDVQTVSPNWLTKPNDASPNAERRAEGTYKVTDPATGNVVSIPQPQSSAFNRAVTPFSSKEVPEPTTSEPTPTATNEVPPPPTDLLNKYLAGVTQNNQPTLAEAEKTAAQLPPEQKQSFWESILKDLYGGKDSMFNQKDLIRFIGGAAFRAATGDNINRALRGASVDTITTSDKRHTFEQSEDAALNRQKISFDQQDERDMTKDLRAQHTEYVKDGYAPDNVRKYIESVRKDPKRLGDPSLLGEPKTTVTNTGELKKYTMNAGPLMGEVVWGQPVKYATGRRKGDEDVLINGIPMNQYAATLSRNSPDKGYLYDGYRAVPYDDALHSKAAQAATFDSLHKQLKDDTESAIRAAAPKDQHNNAKSIGLDAATIANQAAKWAVTSGLNPQDPRVKSEMSTITTAAVRQFILDQKENIDAGKVTVNDITPYIAANRLVAQQGISPADFTIGNKRMSADMIAGLDTKLSNKVKRQEDESPSAYYNRRVDTLKDIKMAYQKEVKDKTLKFEDSKEQSAFYQYAMSKLK
jgi:hypothetical protein